MRIIIDDDQNPGDKLTKLMERAAELALSREGIGHEGCEVSLSFVTAEEMRELNFEYRGVDETTDVLSFPMYESSEEIWARRHETERASAEARNFTGKCRSKSNCLSEASFGFAGRDQLEISSFEDKRAELSATGAYISPLILGDVVICREVAEKQAGEIGQSVEREVLYLFVHSMFHLLGYDHKDEDGKGAMRIAEEEILGEINR